MILKPFKNNDSNPVIDPDSVKVEEVIEVPANLQVALSAAGLVNKSKDNLDEVRSKFTAAGAGIDAIAAQVANIMNRGETDASRLKACDIALRVAGIMAEMDERPSPEIVINITNKFGSKELTVINLVCPEKVEEIPSNV